MLIEGDNVLITAPLAIGLENRDNDMYVGFRALQTASALHIMSTLSKQNSVEFKWNVRGDVKSLAPFSQSLSLVWETLIQKECLLSCMYCTYIHYILGRFFFFFFFFFFLKKKKK